MGKKRVKKEGEEGSENTYGGGRLEIGEGEGGGRTQSEGKCKLPTKEKMREGENAKHDM